MRLGYDFRNKRGIACSNPARSTGFSSPSPPFLTGSASSSRSLVVHVWPVIDGTRLSLIACSNGSSSSSISDISIYTLSDLGDLSNLIGSLSRTIQPYSLPSEWIMCELAFFPFF